MLVARLIHSVLRRMPSDIRLRTTEMLASVGVSSGSPMYASLIRIARLGFRPRVLVDVGACHGDWSREALQIWPEAKVLMFEARASVQPKLQALVARSGGRAIARTALLGAERRPAVDFFELEAGGTGSSVLEELSEVARKKVELPMYRLDDELVAQLGAATVDLLKLDVQGYELEVLAGAPRALQSAEVVVMEVALLPYNKGAPLFDETFRFMHDQGFALFDFATLMRDGRGRVFHTDAVFVRRSSGLRG